VVCDPLNFTFVLYLIVGVLFLARIYDVFLIGEIACEDYPSSEETRIYFKAGLT
jgi:hypothetical protein